MPLKYVFLFTEVIIPLTNRSALTSPTFLLQEGKLRFRNGSEMFWSYHGFKPLQGKESLSHVCL